MRIESRMRGGPLYLLPNVDLSDPNSREILLRLNLYAGIYLSHMRDPRFRLGVVVIDSNSYPRNIKDYANLDILILGTNMLTFFFGIFKKNSIFKIGSRTLIAGDPVFGFLSAFLIKIMKSPTSHIQLQFHGDTYSSSIIHDSKSFIRFLISRLSLKVANSIRVVSHFQIKELEPLARKHAEFFVAPIPLNYSKIPHNRREIRFGVGFIGRLHRERGSTEFVEIVHELHRRKFYEPIYVIGDGPDKDYIVRELEKNNLNKNVIFVGEIEAGDLCYHYSKLKVILSCAPNEGYGLTLREGALSGIDVVARKSPGAIEAKVDFDSYIHLYQSIHEASELIIEAYNRKYIAYSNADKIHSQKTRELRSISNWISSW